jgi:hypothetical protein
MGGPDTVKPWRLSFSDPDVGVSSQSISFCCCERTPEAYRGVVSGYFAVFTSLMQFSAHNHPLMALRASRYG